MPLNKNLFLFVSSLTLTGCCNYNPVCEGDVSYSKESFWQGPEGATCYWYQKVPALATQLPELPTAEETLDLYRIIDIALSNQPSTQRSWADARAAAYNLGASKSALYPNVSLQESLSFTKQNLSSSCLESPGIVEGTTSVVGIDGAGYFKTLVSDLLVSYLVLDFGGRSASIEAARQALYASNWTHNRTIQTVLNDVINAYYLHINAKALLEARSRDVADAQASYNAALMMKEAGVKTRADLLQAKSNLLEMLLDEQEARGNLQTSMGTLANKMGLPANTRFNVVGLPDHLDVKPLAEDAELLMAVAKEHRPDLKASYADLLHSEALYASARSDAMPSLSANVDIEQDSYLHQSQLNGYVCCGSLTLNVPLYSGCLYAYNIRKAKARVEAAIAGVKARESDIYLDVVNAYYDYTTAVETVKYSNELLLSTEENYAVALHNYKEGIGTIIDVLAAQAALANARSEYVEARIDWVTALVDIAYSTGTIGEKI